MELLDYNRVTSIERDKYAQEAAYAGLESMQTMIQLLSHHHHHQKVQKILQMDCSIVANTAIRNFKKVVSVLSRSGHARCRRAPACTSRQGSSLAHLSNSTLMEALAISSSSSEGFNFDGHRGSASSARDIQSLDVSPKSTIQHAHARKMLDATHGSFLLNVAQANLSCTSPPSTTTSSLPSVCIDGSITNENSSIFRQAFGTGRPLLCATKRKSFGNKSEDADAKCHRKSRNERVVRVPCVDSKMADTHSDGFAWRKYGSKPIKGSPYPRGYYRCSTMRGCPAKKHVQLALDDANMQVVTYAGKHSHSQGSSENAKLI